jgi:hypothetical protein
MKHQTVWWLEINSISLFPEKTIRFYKISGGENENSNFPDSEMFEFGKNE